MIPLRGGCLFRLISTRTHLSILSVTLRSNCRAPAIMTTHEKDVLPTKFIALWEGMVIKDRPLRQKIWLSKRHKTGKSVTYLMYMYMTYRYHVAMKVY